MWKEEAQFEDMMYLSHKLTGGSKGVYTALNNPNGHNCNGANSCDGKFVRCKALDISLVPQILLSSKDIAPYLGVETSIWWPS